MSSITRVMMNLPQLPGDKVRTKVLGNKIFTRVTKPNGDVEASIIEKGANGMTLLKSAFTNERGSTIFKKDQYHVVYDKKSGRVFDYNA